jgi:hypothetical protein
MIEDEQPTGNSLVTNDNVKTEYSLSLLSSTHIQTYRLNINLIINKRRQQFYHVLLFVFYLLH